MSEHNVLNIVTGFTEAIQEKDELAKTGTDFKEIRGQVQQTVNQLHPKRLKLKVIEIVEETPTTKTLRFATVDGGTLPPFQAGQYINLFVDIDGVLTARPYAISSSPLQRHFYDLTVKRAQGGFVSGFLLDQVCAGQHFLSTSPMGTFCYNPLFHGDDLVFLAGGSGSAPARSMLLEILERQLPYQFHLIYVNSFEDDVIYAQELQALAEQYQNFKLTTFVTRPGENYQGRSGRLSTEILQQLLGRDLEHKMFYICGPTPFNETSAMQLQQLGIKSRRIRIEANGAPKQPDANPGWPAQLSLEDEVVVTVRGRGSFKTTAGEPLLNSLERHGYSAENACRSGECSLCRVKLVSGSVFNPPEAHLRKSDKDFGWIYSCVAFPIENIEVQL
ncbi:FAD-binding oxidoreductase [Acinetobacter sichuanensis]|uniref:FAD-binding oxidoreductase n=1 Tax=Acinetobacter sichuanensis TaxID=2136183 RepID=A0A371YR14_9GAMM|nr:FAD-binding oxidoreductase [Acinetobacter sichuanensis]RFC83909.1 flavodoxin reductase [Acinetobacter sichuanensis]